MPGTHLTVAKCLLVDVAHIRFTQPHQLALHQQRDQLTGSARIDRIHAGMNLDPGRNTQHQLTPVELVAYVACSTVAAGKQQQVHTQLAHLPGNGFSVFSGCFRWARQRPDHLAVKAHISQQIGAHHPRGSQQPDAITQRQQRLQRLPYPAVRLGFNAHCQRLLGYAIGALERRTTPASGLIINPRRKRVL